MEALAVAKKSTSRRTTGRSRSKQEDNTNASADVRAAEAAVHIAQQELEHALDRYRSVRQRAAEKIDHLKESSAGDLLGDSLDYVSRHPRQGVVVAGLLGFFLGRLFRR